jgi:hypothetical protein
MSKHESLPLPVDADLPRPVVLRPDDLASVAAAGLAMLPAITGRVVIAGGIPPAPYMSAMALS